MFTDLEKNKVRGILCFLFVLSENRKNPKSKIQRTIVFLIFHNFSSKIKYVQGSLYGTLPSMEIAFIFVLLYNQLIF